MTPLIELRHCHRRFDGGRIVALDGVSLSVARGDFAAITGPSGSGKSTVLDIMCGLDEPDDGAVLIDGKAVVGRAAWADIRAARIGFVFQSFCLIPTLTASENVELAMLWRDASAARRRQRADMLLTSLGLGARTGQYPLELSGGERQRVAIARALANEPEIVLADEPTGSLDQRASAEIVNLLAKLHHESGITVVLVTHDRAISERCQRQIEIGDGRIVSDAYRASADAIAS